MSAALKKIMACRFQALRIAVGAIKYFYKHILDEEAHIGNIPYPRKEEHLNAFLTGSEVKRLLDLTYNLKDRLILKIVYSAGLRRGELMNLRPEDFDWKNMQIMVRQGKGKKDRLTVLAKSLQQDYHAYMKDYAPQGYLFFGSDRSIPAYGNSGRTVSCGSCKTSRYSKESIHSYTSAFVRLTPFKSQYRYCNSAETPRHWRIQSTMKYLHLNHRFNTEPRSPMDVIYK